MESLEKRDKKVFKYLLKHYIYHADPVGSGTLTQEYPLEVSSATVRNIFKKLEDIGLLSQPHISAGRVPTAKGYRFYIDYLIEKNELSQKEKEVVQNFLWSEFNSIEDFFTKLTKILAAVTKELSVVIAPLRKDLTLKRIQFFKLSETHLLLIFIIEGGPVKSRIIDFDEIPSPEALRKINSRLNERLSGLTLDEIRASIKERLKDIIKTRQDFIKRLIDASQSLFYTNEEAEIFIGGRARVLEQPEFNQGTCLKKLMSLLDERRKLLNLLKLSKQEADIDVSLCEDDIDFLSVMKAPFFSPVGKGIMGLIGPRRMEYERLITLLKYISDEIEDTFKTK